MRALVIHFRPRLLLLRCQMAHQGNRILQGHGQGTALFPVRAVEPDRALPASDKPTPVRGRRIHLQRIPAHP